MRLALLDGKIVRSIIGSRGGSSMGGGSSRQIRSSRIKYLYKSVAELNKTLEGLDAAAGPMLAKLDAAKVKEVAHELAGAVDRLTEQLERTSGGLHKLSQNKTLLGLAFASDGEEILDNLCDAVDRVTATIRKVRERIG